MALAQELHHSCRRLQGCVHTHIHSPRSLPAKHPTPSHHLASRSHKIAPMLFQGHSRIFKVLQGPSRSPQRSLDMSARLTLFSAIFMIERCDEMQACHANICEHALVGTTATSCDVSSQPHRAASPRSLRRPALYRPGRKNEKDEERIAVLEATRSSHGAWSEAIISN